MLIITTTKKIDRKIARIKREVADELITRFVRQGLIDPAAFRSCESIVPDLTNFDTSSVGMYLNIVDGIANNEKKEK